jgi:uncharacterized coiled-coil DUF342 family protein
MDKPIQESTAQIESAQAQVIALYEKLEQVRESETQLKTMIVQVKATIEQLRSVKASVAEAESK